MAAPVFKSYQQILGDQIRKLLSVTGLNDLSKGSVLSTLLEAAAQEDFAQYGALIDLLNNFSLDNTSGADLDKKAEEFSLSRLTATSASGYVKISDSTFTKISTSIYIGASPPIAGDTTIKVANASQITFPGQIYIGRGTANFEGPITLSGLPVDNISFWSIPLATPLSKNHNLNETVILTQGGDRIVLAGTAVRIPPNNVSGEISFTVANDQILADGEDTLNNILVFCAQLGSIGNAPINSIVEFESPPFNGAEVTNLTAFSNARDLETDQELRDRIKNHIQSLSRGTTTAILSGVVGVSDSDDNKRVASASLIEPTDTIEIGKLYIDDGTGFEPSFSGQGLETIVDSAVGTEQFLQLGNFPIVKAQVESIESQPYNIGNGDTLIVKVNDEEETIVFLADDFRTEGAAKALEVVEAINNRSVLIEARTFNGQKNVVIFAKVVNNEKIQVVGGTANDSLLFPTDPVFTLKLYKDDVLLSKDGETAFVESVSFNVWGAIPTPATLNIQIDGKPTQYLRLQNNLLETSADGLFWQIFSGTTFSDLGVTMSTAAANQWATVLNQLMLGAAVSVNGDKLKILSNLEKSLSSQIFISGGNLVGPQGWPTDLVQGQISDYILNRFNGQIELLDPLSTGNSVTAGTNNTRGQVISDVAPGGSFDLSLDNFRIPAIYVVVDGSATRHQVNLSTGDTVTVAASGPNWRYTASSVAFSTIEAADYILVVSGPGGWLTAGNTGIFRAVAVDVGGTWFEILNPLGVPQVGTVDDANDLQAFLSDTPPQKVTFIASFTTVDSAATQINNQVIGTMAEALDNDSLRLRTNTFDDEVGSLQVIATAGNASNLGFSSTRAASITSHIAALASLNEVGFRIYGAQGSLTTNDTTDPFTDVIDAARAFTSDGLTKPGQWVKYLTGTNEDIKSIIRTITGATSLLLRDNTPSLVSAEFLNTAVATNLYQQFYPYDLEDSDSLVVILDGDDVNKTYNVPLSRSGRIDTAYSTTTFDALDTDANVTGTDYGDSLWLGYDFGDYKVWFKARWVVNPTNDKNALIIRSKKFGKTGEKIRISYDYNTSAGQLLSASVISSATNTTILVLLETGAERITTQDGTTRFDITTGIGTTTYTWDGTGTNPGFGVVVVGDIATFNSVNFNTVNNGTFKISATDNATFITVLNGAGVGELDKTLGNSAAMSIFPLSGNTGLTVQNTINNTSPVNLVIDAVLTDQDPFGTTNDGTGNIVYSTKDDPTIVSQYLSLVDGENWVRDFSNPASPQFTLKSSLAFIAVIGGAGNIYQLDTAPIFGSVLLGEPFKLIPTTVKNLVDHFNRPTITAISLNAEVARSEDGQRLQIASLLTGSQGEVFVSGGLGNANLALVQSNASISGSSLKVAIPTSSAVGFHNTQAIKIANQFITNKVNTFNTATSATVTTISTTTKRYTLNKRALGLVPATSNITVTSLGSNQYRFTLAAGGSFSTVSPLDEVFIPTPSPFAAGNEGSFPVIAATASTIDVINPSGVAEGPIVIAAATDFTVSVPFFTQWKNQATAATEIKVEKLSQDVVRYRWTGVGPSPNFSTNGLRIDDVFTVTDAAFATSNQGRFRVIGVTSTFVEVVNSRATEEIVLASGGSGFYMVSLDSAEVNDLLNIGAIATAWFLEENQGQLEISAVGRDGLGNHYVEVTNSSGLPEGPTALGVNFQSFFVLEGYLFETYRTIDNMSVNPSNITTTFLYFSPVANSSRITTAAGSQIFTLNKLGYSTLPTKGIDGYKYWTGLLRRVQRTVDGYDVDPVTFPGIKAAGVQIEVTPPLLQNVTIGVDVRTISGTPISILIDSIKSAILSYINSLGVGEDVVLSQIVKRVQDIPGIEAVRITDPAPTNNQAPERIIIQDNEKAIAFEDDIAVG